MRQCPGAAAVALQNELVELQAARVGLVAQISKGENEIAGINARLEFLEGYVFQNWDRPLADHIHEAQRHEFFLPRLKKFIAGWKQELATLDPKIKAFKSANGLE